LNEVSFFDKLAYLLQPSSEQMKQIRFCREFLRNHNCCGKGVRSPRLEELPLPDNTLSQANFYKVEYPEREISPLHHRKAFTRPVTSQTHTRKKTPALS